MDDTPRTARLPEVLWIFASQLSFMTVHNLTFTRALTSSSMAALSDGNVEQDWLPFIPNPNATHWRSPFSQSLIRRYLTEDEGEEIRRSEFGHLPSRLGALFAFGDEETCRQVAADFDWELAEVRKFRPVMIHGWARLNMSYVTLLNNVTIHTNGTGGSVGDIWRAYWSGFDAPISVEVPDADPGRRKLLTSPAPVWEYLIDGRVDLDEGTSSTGY